MPKAANKLPERELPDLRRAKWADILESYENQKPIYTQDGVLWEILKISEGKAKLKSIFDAKGRYIIGTANIPVEELFIK